MSGAAPTLGVDRAAQSGLLLMVGAMAVAPAMDVIAKLLVAETPAAEVAAGRFLAQSLVLGPIVLLAGRPPAPGRLHAAAGACLGLALLAIILALQVMPVANVIAIFFVEPLILTLVAALLLGERLGWRRLTAVAVGLGGALIVLRPNVAEYGWAAAWPLAAAALFALYMTATRAMTRRGGLVAMQFWIGAFAFLTLAAGVLVGAVATGTGPEAPDGRSLALFAGLGLLAAATHQMIAQALARVDAGAIAPLQYLEIVSATALGWLVFGDFPDRWTWVGTAVIVGAGLYVAHRERRVGARASPPAPA